MRVLKVNDNHKVISFGPYKKGNHQYETKVYEKGNSRLVVSTKYTNDTRSEQYKTYTNGYSYVKQIVVNFVNGLRDKVTRTR